jgi:organic radical activating enzyme
MIPGNRFGTTISPKTCASGDTYLKNAPIVFYWQNAAVAVHYLQNITEISERRTMTNILDTVRRLFTRAEPIPTGTYHYQAPPDDPRNYRLHLRIEEDGDGILIINASTVLHLNQTAAEYAYYLVKNLPSNEVADKMTSRYNVDYEQARHDYQNLAERIQILIETPDLDPVTFLDFERQTPFSRQVTAPYRLDCSLTYQLPEGAAPDSAPVERAKEELTTAEWKSIFDKAWQVGIPHLVFTGGEPTLREDLPELIAHAEKNGQVTGLLTDGLRLADQDYLNTLLQTGLDHLMIVPRQDAPQAWQALDNALAADIYVAVHLTLTEENQERIIEDVLPRLADTEVRAISLSASDESLVEALETTRQQVANLGFELVWNLPVPYSALNPIEQETDNEGQRQGAGRAWMYIEPDGDVLPTQGVNRVLGNLLNDPWEVIWNA